MRASGWSVCAGRRPTTPSATFSRATGFRIKWLNPEQNPDALALLKEKGIDDAKLPVVLFGDGTALVQPTTTELAQKVGLRTQAQQEFYDVVVVGAGPAGLAAGVYGASEGLRTLIVEPNAVGRAGWVELED